MTATVTVDATGTAQTTDQQPAAAAAPAVPADRNALTTQLLTIAVLEARVAAAKADLRAALAGVLRPGESVVGCLDPDDDDPAEHGTSLGRVLKKRGAKRWAVTDTDALLAWVREHAPTEVVVTEKVRDSFTTKLLAACKADGGLVQATGELLVPDGIEYREAAPTLQVSLSAEAEALVADAVQAGRLHADGTLAIEA
jgi:hypothetical protein